MDTSSNTCMYCNNSINYFINTAQQCVLCTLSYCTTCTSLAVCNTCSSTFVLVDGKCVCDAVNNYILSGSVCVLNVGPTVTCNPAVN